MDTFEQRTPPHERERVTVSRIVDIAGVVAIIVFSAAVFALVAAHCTKFLMDANAWLVFFAVYWGLFARLMLFAVKRGAVVSYVRDLWKSPERRLADWERRVLEVFLLNVIRIELLVSTVMLDVSLYHGT
jgi:hypothetical protein